MSGKGHVELCKYCLRKDPPVDTILIMGVNTKAGRHRNGDFICDDCHKIRLNRYSNEKFRELKEEQHLKAIETLTQAWDDPAYRHKKEFSDRVVKTWDKNGWRSNDQGFRKDWICEVIFPRMWNVDPNTVVEDYFNNNPDISKTTRLSIKHHLLRFVSSEMEFFVLAYREKARSRWEGIVQSIIKKYQGRDKLVSDPAYIDPITKEHIHNYYLLSNEKDRQRRESKHISKIDRTYAIIDEEKTLVQHREDIVRREQAKQNKNPNTNTERDSNNSNIDKEEDEY